MPQTLLAIDDSRDIHELLDVRLSPEGLSLHHALDAADGLAKARDILPDLILLDVDLDGESGFEVCKKLKEQPATAGIPVIFLTMATDVSSKVQGFDLGAVDYVLKPFDAAELRARVRATLRTKRFHDLLSARAHVDGLTGIWNRAYFDQRMGEAVSNAQRGRTFSLVMLDLDHFKSFNDSFGHPFGDRVLQSVGDVLQTFLRTSDVPCRFGGEEFALILTDADEEQSVRTAERVRQRISELQLCPKDRPVQVTASLGVACSSLFEKNAVSVIGVLTAGDEALYQAKHEGRNRVCAARRKAGNG